MTSSVHRIPMATPLWRHLYKIRDRRRFGVIVTSSVCENDMKFLEPLLSDDFIKTACCIPSNQRLIWTDNVIKSVQSASYFSNHVPNSVQSTSCFDPFRPIDECLLSFEYSKLRVIRLQLDLKIMRITRKFELRGKKCIGFGQFGQNICSDYAEFTVPNLCLPLYVFCYYYFMSIAHILEFICIASLLASVHWIYCWFVYWPDNC